MKFVAGATAVAVAVGAISISSPFTAAADIVASKEQVDRLVEDIKETVLQSLATKETDVSKQGQTPSCTGSNLAVRRE